MISKAFNENLPPAKRRHVDAFFRALRMNRMDVVKDFLDKYADIANAVGAGGNTPLTLAAGYGHLDLCALLLEKGARLDDVNKAGCTAIMSAAGRGHLGVVSFLFDKGARIDMVNTKGQDLRAMALERSKTAVVAWYDEAVLDVRVQAVLGRVQALPRLNPFKRRKP